MDVNAPTYYKAELYGNPNSGKSYGALSICELIPPKSEKTNILFFTNEANWKNAVDEWSAYKPYIHPYYHQTLDQYETDWIDAFKELECTTKIPKSQPEKHQLNFYQIQEKIHAVILDEAEFLYREGFVKRFVDIQKRKDPAFIMRQSLYGDPRADFVLFTKAIFGLPCHVIINSKIGYEYEGVRQERADGTLGAKSWQKTGKEKYRLPESQEYEPSIRWHLFSKPRTAREGEDEIDESGDRIEYFNYYGRLMKNKVDRDIRSVIYEPTFKKTVMLEQKLRIAKKKRDKPK